MPLTGHLKELRNRGIVCAVVLFAAAVLGLSRAQYMVDRLLDIGSAYGYRFVYISPQELLLEYFSIAFVFAVCVSLPVILYELYAFAGPGLSRSEKRLFLMAMLFGLVFACIGVLFAYKIVMPFMLRFLIGVGSGSAVEASVSVQNYVSFLLTIFIIFAAVFELPVVSVLLTQLGIIRVAWMKKFRRVVIVVIFFAAAVITPPDVTSQIMVAIPMIVLYELSIILCTAADKMRSPKEEQDSSISPE